MRSAVKRHALAGLLDIFSQQPAPSRSSIRLLEKLWNLQEEDPNSCSQLCSERHLSSLSGFHVAAAGKLTQRHTARKDEVYDRPKSTAAVPGKQRRQQVRGDAVARASTPQQSEKNNRPTNAARLMVDLDDAAATHQGVAHKLHQRPSNPPQDDGMDLPPKDRRLPKTSLKATKHSLKKFKESHKAMDQALAIYISAKAFPKMVDGFQKSILRAGSEQLEAKLCQASRTQAVRLLFQLFAEYAVKHHSAELQAYRDSVQSLDLRQPHLWYPVARALKRKFVYHAGPTNSGKTFTALQAMRSAPSGLYCGPLRLLAVEIYDTLNAAGTYCNLITGQEKRLVPGAQHTSCTIEMMSLAKRVDVAVIDEIQLLGSDNRGWAWTRALQGCPANEIHLCGDGSAISLVKQLANAMDEPLEIRNYERFTPVEVDEAGLVNGFKDVRPGDCLVAFSRKSIYEIKSLVEAVTGLRTCVVYGALPPETRRQQARLFNEEDSGYSVLVASDAVGMGLNLNIRRIIFTTLTKFRGTKQAQISVPEIKQIAGRAGRRNSQFPVGYVTCLHPSDTPILKGALEVSPSQFKVSAAGLFPEFEQLEAYASKSLKASFIEILEHFSAEARLDGTYFFCQQDGMQEAAKLLANIEGLSLQERFYFCMTPLNLREPRLAAALLQFATTYAAKAPVTLEVVPAEAEPKTPEELDQMEQLHQIVSAWLWLSNRFEAAAFPRRAEVEELSDALIAKMLSSLEHMFHGAGQSEVPSKAKLLKQSIQAMRQPLLTNLSGDAKQHFRVASKTQINRTLAAQISAQRREREAQSAEIPALPQLKSPGARNRAFAAA